MIDNLALCVAHGLMLLAAFLLLKRPDLDREGAPPKTGIRSRRKHEEPPLA